MMHEIDGKRVYVVDFDTMPELPVTGLTAEELVYETLLSGARGYVSPSFDPNFPTQGRYALALTQAIETGIIKEPGKYGIHFETDLDWIVYKINE